MTRPLLLTLAALALSPPTAPAALPEAPPEQVGMDPERLSRIDEVVGAAIDGGKVPGAVVLVGRGGCVVYAKAFGRRAVEPAEEALTRDTVFDLASLTKPVATATSLMALLERGEFRLSDPIGKHLPELGREGIGRITIEQLLRHRGGLIADNALSDYDDGPERAWERIAALEPIAEPGERFVYSDVGFLILGRLVERLSGATLPEFAAATVFEPLGMADTRFGMTPGRGDESFPVDRTAPTERDGDDWLRGVVHDPRARALGGYGGHAGLFSTADDLAIYAQMLLDEGVGRDGRRVLAPATVRAMIDPGDTPAGQRRGLGWDVATGYSSPRGDLFGPRSFGHTGFTGTSLWIDPDTQTFVILLTSRLHPGGDSPSPIDLRAKVATLAAAAIVGPADPASGGSHPVDCGIDVLIRRKFEGLVGRRVGLVTNHTGRARSGASTIDVLAKAPGVTLVALFSPEHGLRGAVDRAVPDSTDEATGLPIHSLYGDDRRPSPESLEGLDVLVFDIQDVGARFYTYISTLGYVLEAAKQAGVAALVLDRPNPIGGRAVGGPVRDEGFASFIAYHPLPVRHGLTVGELARLYNAERGIGADLTVIPCEGWRRQDLYDATGLLWVNPSPNMRSPTEALLYPGVGLLEATNLANGRGTDTPFERVGAPWIDPTAFAGALNGLGLPGVRATPVRFTPDERQYAGQDCGGAFLAVTDRDRFDPIDLGIGLAVVLRRLYPGRWEPDGFLRMLADRRAYTLVLEGKSVSEVRESWRGELEAFRAVRARYQLYP